jgi:hypothetical protein
MWHAPCIQVNWVESWFFGHKLFQIPNEQCEPILDIYVLRVFQWYKERHKPLNFDPCNHSLNFWESTGTPSPKMGVALGEWGFIPLYSFTFLTLPGVCDVTPGLLLALISELPLALTPRFPLGSQPYNPFALVTSPKLGLRQSACQILSFPPKQ